MLRLNQVFKRVLRHPLSNLEEFWEKYNQFVLAQQLHVLATPEELAAIGAEEEMDEGLIRVKIVNSVEALKNKTQEGIQRRQAFEAGIDRNYFHVTPVGDAALNNWHAYLDYEEIAGDDTRCELLYERCLISCANYEQMWVRFALWKERTQGFDAANAVYQRAVDVFLKYRATMYLEYAVFLEAHGKLQIARDTYTQVLNNLAPKLVEAFVRAANFERRHGKLDAVKGLYERGLEQIGEAQPDAFAFLAISYASFAQRVMADTELARSIYERATKTVPSSLVLWLQFIQLEIASTLDAKERVIRVSGVFNRALAEITTLSNDEKNDLWLQYADFMETYSSDIADVRGVQQKEMMWRRKNAVTRDRTAKVLFLESSHAANGDYDDSAAVGNKRPRYDSAGAMNGLAISSGATTPVTSATTDAATAAAYAQYYQQQYQVTTCPA
jgi:pre-mRNA-processing factor 39